MISREIRALISAGAKRGMSVKEMALVYGVSERTIIRLLKRERETGGMEPRTQNCGRHSILAEYELEQLRTLVEVYPDMTLEELKEFMKLSVDISTISKILKKMGFRYKKKRSTPASVIMRKTNPSAMPIPRTSPS
jgi:transposase